MVSLLLSYNLSGQGLPVGFTLGKVQDGYQLPMGLLVEPTHQQLFVWERKGLLWVSNWNGVTFVRQPTPLIDLTQEVADWGEVGLLSVCLDPLFAQNGRIYLFYAVDRHHLLYFGTPQYDPNANLSNEASIGRVTRYTTTRTGGSLSTDYASRQVLLGETKQTGVPLLKGTHLGGTLIMGRDGTLLVSTGDNASWAVIDTGSSPDTFFQTALRDSIIRPSENVGALRAQQLGSLCGKVLRIDTARGEGLPSNPFYDAANPRSARSRVWALGFRNPFKMALQPNTGSTNPAAGNPGTLVVGDVGWFSWEELTVLEQGGLNGGWPLFEGIDPAPGYPGTNVVNAEEPGGPVFERLCLPPTSPLADPDPATRRLVHHRPALDWLRDQPVARVPAFSGSTPTRRTLGTAGAPPGEPFGGNCAIGGVFYQGSLFPAPYRNTYVWADFGQNWIKSLVYQASPSGEGWVGGVQALGVAGTAQSIVALAENPIDGSLVYLDTYSGEVQRIGYGDNRPPVARLSVDRSYGASPLGVVLDGSASSDPDGNALSYEWDFGDGSTGVGAQVSHSFSSTTTQGFTVRLVVRDQGGLSDSRTQVISVNNQGPPQVQIVHPVGGWRYPLDRVSQVSLQATAGDVGGGSTPQGVAGYEWQVILRHNTHEHREPVITAVSPTVSLDPTGCDLGETYSYLIRCRVTDNGGLTGSDSVVLYPDCGSGSISVGDVVAQAMVDSVGLSWRNPGVGFDEVLVGVRADTGFSDKPSGTAYVADREFGGGGSELEGGQVVYRGVGSGVTVRGLAVSHAYYFRVYTRVGAGWSGGVEVRSRPLAGAGCRQYTLMSGSWSDPGVWSCYRVPEGGDVVEVRHQLSIPAGHTAQAKAVLVDTNGNLLFGANALLRLNP